MARGLYVHVPFCAAICNYCNFNRGLLDEGLKRRYVDALVEEIRRCPEAGAPIDTIFFGGGTPSLLAPDEVSRILRACRDTFPVAADAEVTLEANPETVSHQTLAGYRSAGVNRLSYGVQSFRDVELTRLGRLHSADTARHAVRLARGAGFDNISLDLMLWLPGQRLHEWLESVDALVALEPEHASIYLLEIYPNAPLRDEMARGGWSVAPDEVAAEMYLQGLSRLDAAGFEQYEISNAARPGRRARHNMLYWQAGHWLGLGCGAHSTWDGVRWRNLSSSAEYVERMAAGGSVRVEARTLSARERLEEALFMGLRLTEGLDLEALAARHGVDVFDQYRDELSRFVDLGVLVHEPGRRLALTREGMLVASEIMMVFIGGTVR
ncbi:MAG: radical SAM family heme chaperone HemW [Vicinamibacterales bacterium]